MEQLLAHRGARALRRRERDEPVGFEGVRRPGPLQRPGHTQVARLRLETLVKRMNLAERHAVLAGDEFAEGKSNLLVRSRVELEGARAHDDEVALLELAQRRGELT